MNIIVHFLGRHRSRRLTDFAHRTLALALDRFAGRVRDVRVRIRDENAQRGGEDHRCSLEVRLADGGRLHLQAQAAEPESALHRLAHRAERLLRSRSRRARRESRR